MTTALPLTFEQAKAKLSTRTDWTPEQLQNLLARTAITVENAAPDAITLLYAKPVTMDLVAGDLVNYLARQTIETNGVKQKLFISISDTDQGRLMRDNDFKRIFIVAAKAEGWSAEKANIAKISNAIGANVPLKMAFYLHAA